jgi:hypothetical protein
MNIGISNLRKGGRKMSRKINNANYIFAIVQDNKNILNNPALLVI